MLGVPVAELYFCSAKIAAHDIVDHASDGVRAVDGRGAVAQHFDVIDALRRHVIDVDRVCQRLGHRVGGEPAAIDQDQRAAGADVAQIDAGIVAAGAGRTGLGFIQGNIGDLRERGEQIHRGEGVARLQGLGVDDGDGQHVFHVEAPDVRSRHHHGLERDDILILLGARSGGADLAVVGRAGTGDHGEEKRGRERAVRRAKHRSETAGRT